MLPLSARPLFSNKSLRGLFEEHKHGIRQEIQCYREEKLMNENEEELVSRIAKKFEIDVPCLLSDQTTYSPGETEVQVPNDGQYALVNPSQPQYISGMCVTVSIPFEGDMDVFFLKTSRYTLNPPQACVSRSSLEIVFKDVKLETEAIRRETDNFITNVERYLGWLREYATQWREQVESIVRTCIQNRKEHIVDLRHRLRRRAELEGGKIKRACGQASSTVKTQPNPL